MTAPARCSSPACRARITWVITEANRRRMPLDPTPAADGNVVLVGDPLFPGEKLARVLGPLEVAALDPDVPRFHSHFTTCPDPPGGKR